MYYSSDYVFDGTKDGYVEDDQPNPLNVYGETKLEAERVIAEILPEAHVAIRTAWVYGPDEREMNFAIRLVKALEAGDTVRVPADQWGTPTYTEDLADVTLALLNDGAAGLFHAVGPDYLSRIDLSERICGAFGLDRELLEPIPTDDLDQGAARPWRVRMSTAKLDALGLPARRGVDHGLRDLHAWWTA